MVGINNRYQRREQIFQKKLVRCQRESLRICIWKISVLICGIILLALFIYMRNFPTVGGVTAFGIVSFLFLDRRHLKVINKENLINILVRINQDADKRLQGSWKEFEDCGLDFCDESHPYTGDLDIFGPNSLFQWINCSQTFEGRRQLAKLFTARPRTTEEIKFRQEAIVEMASHLGWRQRLMAEGILMPEPSKNPEALLKWADDPNNIFRSSWSILKVRLLSSMTLFLFLITLIVKLPIYPLLILLIIHYLLLRYRRREREKVLTEVAPFDKQLQGCAQLFKILESHPFRSNLLSGLQKELQVRNKSAFYQIGRLSKITDLISNRNNIFHSIVNLLTLWDYHCLFALEEWKKYSGHKLRRWMEILGCMEALASLAVIRFDHPGWAIPVIQNDIKIYIAKKLGHPLLSEERICNDLSINHHNNVLLITGSNMSGKSTYLRTTGINLILAYSGAPACAASMTCCLLTIYTCMRVKDILTQNISSFYAEILRIKQIVDATKSGDPIFFLLDEIFRGTNSKDRHTGAKILINKLSKAGAIGLVSTHDLELTEMEKSSNGRIKNYYFQEYYQDSQINFDYCLRSGVSNTRNAIYLIKSAGIDIDEIEIEDG